ncbi:amino acid ABC transporter substrate-binding protein [bacterium]|nr:amino acid ABC transporter substrate-binding protein [bacterium]
MKKLLFILFLPLLLAGCDKDNGSATLRVATSPDSPPFAFKMEGEVCGSDIDLVKEVAKDTGKQLVIIEMPFGELLESVRSGKADLAVGTISITEERKKIVAFSNPYYKTGCVITSPLARPVTDADGLKGKKVGVTQGARITELCLEKGASVVPYSNSWAIAEDIVNGKLDCAINDAPMARAYAKDKDELAITSPFISDDHYGVACGQENKSLLKAVNKIIKKMKRSGDLQKRIDSWTRLTDEKIKH